MRRIVPQVLGFLLAATAARAGELDLSLATSAGKPVADAVVMVRPDGGHAAPHPSGTYVMAQKDTQFQPYVLVVPVGAEVSFPNLDPFHHHVYSFARARTFELKLYGRDETRKVRFDRPGVVGVGCNIHDNMSAWIRVVDTPFAAKTGAGGRALVRDLPAGGATVIVWRPNLNAPGSEITRRVSIPANGPVRLALTGDLKASRLRRSGY